MAVAPPIVTGPDAYYSWDSNVPNSKNLQIGDPIALWDKQQLPAISVIEEIETSRGTKVLHRCPAPACNTTRISERKRAALRYRMLRRDIHRLFDDGLLAVQPSKLRIDVAPDLAKYPQYARLHDERLTSRLEDSQIN